VKDDPDDPPIGFIPTKLTPTNVAPPENLRVTIEAGTAPEPGTRALNGLDLAGLSLLRGKPSPIPRRPR
jgi:hypothetical protein